MHFMWIVVKNRFDESVNVAVAHYKGSDHVIEYDESLGDDSSVEDIVLLTRDREPRSTIFQYIY